MATSEGIPSSIDIEFLELNDNPYIDNRDNFCDNVFVSRRSLLSLLSLLSF